MIALGQGDSLQGVASAATDVTYTISGAEITAGVPTYMTLAQGQLAAVAGMLYEAGDTIDAALLSAILLANTSSSAARTVTLFANGSDDAHRIGRLAIPANGSAVLGRDGWRVYDAAGSLQTTTGA